MFQSVTCESKAHIITGYDEVHTDITGMLIPDFNVVVRAMTIAHGSTNIAGYKFTRECRDHLMDFFRREPYVECAQRIEYKGFSVGANDKGFPAGCTVLMPLNKCTDFMLLFPNYSGNGITCFENPMYQLLQLQVGNRTFPTTAVSTIGPDFVRMMLDASDLDSLFLPTDEYANSLTVDISKPGKIMTQTTDLSSFVVIIQCERSGAYDIFFDGMDSGTQNQQIRLRGAPIYSNTGTTRNDVYFDPNHPPPPPLIATLQDSFWLFSIDDRGEGLAQYITDNTFEEVRAKFGARMSNSPY
jgi:hypothetical protein